MSIFRYGPMVPFFAWRPVNTRDAGWVWLRTVARRRQGLAPHITGPHTDRISWQYWRYAPIADDVRAALAKGDGK